MYVHTIVELQRPHETSHCVSCWQVVDLTLLFSPAAVIVGLCFLPVHFVALELRVQSSRFIQFLTDQPGHMPGLLDRERPWYVGHEGLLSQQHGPTVHVKQA